MEIDMQRSFNTDIIDDPIFRRQSTDARLLYFTLYMHRKNHFVGLFQITAEHLALDMRLPVEKVESALQELKGNGFIETEPQMELVWVPEMRRIMTGLNGRQMSGVKTYLFGLRFCPLVARVAKTFGLECPADPFATPLEPCSNPVPKGLEPHSNPPLSNTVSKTDPDQQTEDSRTTPARVAESVPFNALACWDAMAERAGSKLRLAKSSGHATGLAEPHLSNFVRSAIVLSKRDPPFVLAAYEALGDWIAAGGLDWFAAHNTPPWKRVCDHLEDCLSPAIEWDRGGRQPIGPKPRPDWKAEADQRRGPAVPNDLPDTDVFREIQQLNATQRGEHGREQRTE